MTVFIDLTPEEAFQRKHGADQNDRLEKAGLEFHKRVYEGFCNVAKAEPDRYVVVNGRKTPQGIFEDIIAALKERGVL